jgi:hypothetical protein
MKTRLAASTYSLANPDLALTTAGRLTNALLSGPTLRLAPGAPASRLVPYYQFISLHKRCESIVSPFVI